MTPSLMFIMAVRGVSAANLMIKFTVGTKDLGQLRARRYFANDGVSHRLFSQASLADRSILLHAFQHLRMLQMIINKHNNEDGPSASTIPPGGLAELLADTPYLESLDLVVRSVDKGNPGEIDIAKVFPYKKAPSRNLTSIYLAEIKIEHSGDLVALLVTHTQTLQTVTLRGPWLNGSFLIALRQSEIALGRGDGFVHRVYQGIRIDGGLYCCYVRMPGVNEYLLSGGKVPQVAVNWDPQN